MGYKKMNKSISFCPRGVNPHSIGQADLTLASSLEYNRSLKFALNSELLNTSEFY